MLRALRRPVPLILGALLLLLVLAVLLVPLLVPVERVKLIVAERIRAATGAEVTMGKARVAVLPRLRLEVADVDIRGTGADLERATGSRSPLASYQAVARELEVDIAFWPLLSRRLEVGTVRLIAPDVHVVTIPEQPQEVPGERPPGEPAEPAPGGWEFAIAAFEVRDGALRWLEEGSGRSVTITGWRQDVEVQGAPELFRRLARFQAAGGTAGALDPAAAPPGQQRSGSRDEPVLKLGLSVATVSWEGLGEQPGSLGDLALEGTLRVAPEADAVDISLKRFVWRGVDLAADLRLAGSPAQGRLTGTWRLQPVQLAALLADAQTLVPPPEGPVGAWLAGQPVRSGELAGEGQLDLPWPLPEGAPPAQLAAGLSGQFRLRGAQLSLPDGNGTAEVSATATMADGRLLVENLRAAHAEGRFLLEGSAAVPLPGAIGPVTADLRAEGDLARLTDLMAALAEREPGSPPPPRAEGRLKAQLRADIQGAPPLTEKEAWQEALKAGSVQGVRLEGSVQELALQLAQLPEPVRCPSLTFAGSLQDLQFTCEQLTHPAVRGAVRGRVERFLPPTVRLEGDLQRLDVDALTEAMKSQEGAARPQPGGRAAGWLVSEAHAAPAQAPPPAGGAAGEQPPGEAIPFDLTVAFTASAREVVLQKATYTDVRAQGRLASRVLRIDPLSARRGTGTLRGRTIVDWATDPYGQVSFQMTAQEVPVGALLEPYVPAVAAFWSGTVSTEAAGDLLMRDPQRVLQTLTVAGDAISSDGQIDARNMLSGIDTYLGGRQDLLLVKFHRFAHHFRFERGRYHIENLALDGLDTDWLGNGWVGVDGTLDLSLRVKLPPDFRPNLGDLSPLADQLRGQDGRIELAMRLTGRTADPSVQIDLSGARQKLQQNTEQEIRRGVDRLLDKFKRK